MSLQELLAKYVSAQLGMIGERSGSIDRDARVLRTEVQEYATEHGIVLDLKQIDAYICDESRDYNPCQHTPARCNGAYDGCACGPY